MKNPFRNSTLRWRNYVLCLLMLHLGLRRGETLVLPMDALKSEKRFTPTVEIVNWLNVGDNPYQRDPRPEQPSLKTTMPPANCPCRQRWPASSGPLSIITGPRPGTATYFPRWKAIHYHYARSMVFLSPSQVSSPLKRAKHFSSIAGPVALHRTTCGIRVRLSGFINL